MRQWNVDPKIMCRQHLLGEHLEMHMFAGSFSKGKTLTGYIDKGLVELHTISHRHHELVKEMERRGMNHKSPFPILNLPVKGRVNVLKSQSELVRRCEKCRERLWKYDTAMHGVS